MGRRFQAYYIYNDINGLIKKTGFHLQVCCGDDTICLLEQVLLFTEKYSKNPLNIFLKPKYNLNNYDLPLLHSITTTIHKNGVFLNAKVLPEDICKNPLTADNNDGIFVVDLRGTKPKYILMSHNFHIITPEEYFKLYEHEYSEKDEILSEIPYIIKNIRRFEEISIGELQSIFSLMFE